MTAAIIDQPVAGYYKLRLARGAVFVPIHLWFGPTPDPDFPENDMDRSPRWHAVRRGVEVENATAVMDIWHVCAARPIDVREYGYMLAVCRHADRHNKNSPHAKPRKAIELAKTPTLF